MYFAVHFYCAVRNKAQVYSIPVYNLFTFFLWKIHTLLYCCVSDILSKKSRKEKKLRFLLDKPFRVEPLHHHTYAWDKFSFFKQTLIQVVRLQIFLKIQLFIPIECVWRTEGVGVRLIALYYSLLIFESKNSNLLCSIFTFAGRVAQHACIFLWKRRETCIYVCR